MTLNFHNNTANYWVLVCSCLFLSTQINAETSVNTTIQDRKDDFDMHTLLELSTAANGTVYKVEYILFRRTNPATTDEKYKTEPINWLNKQYLALDSIPVTAFNLAAGQKNWPDFSSDLRYARDIKSRPWQQWISFVVERLFAKRDVPLVADIKTQTLPFQIGNFLPPKGLQHSDINLVDDDQEKWVKLEYIGLDLIPKILNEVNKKISVSFVSNPIWSGHRPTEIISAKTVDTSSKVVEEITSDRINPFELERSLLNLPTNATVISAESNKNASKINSNFSSVITDIQSALRADNGEAIAEVVNLTPAYDLFQHIEMSEDFLDINNRLKLSKEYEILDFSTWYQPALPLELEIGNEFTYDLDDYLIEGVVGRSQRSISAYLPRFHRI